MPKVALCLLLMVSGFLLPKTPCAQNPRFNLGLIAGLNFAELEGEGITDYFGVNAGLLGMKRIVSDDVVRHALNHLMDEDAALAWLGRHQRLCLEPALTLPWIMDIDTTVKSLYGAQQGAQIGYNPHKPGRPSHVYHSYFMANTRLCLGVDVLPGKEHASAHSQPGLWRCLDALP